jgi:flagellar hook protein FlgE
MKNLQTKMDVISNNIANVNTVGFKSSRVMFQDIMSQTSAPATAPTDTVGGQNPRQIGLGVQVGSIDTVHTTGAPQSTGRALDFYLTGPGYFIVKDGADSDLFTRDGVFTRDSNGEIVNSAGMKIQGNMLPAPVLAENYSADDFNNVPSSSIRVPATLDDATFHSMAIDENGLVTAKYGGQDYVLGRVSIATFTNPDALEKIGGNNYRMSLNTGNPIVGNAGENGAGLMVSGAIEMSNVDLANEFTEMIVASRAYQANSRSITTSDEMLQELINLKR